jgi:FixJ family two-component response regulator
MNAAGSPGVLIIDDDASVRASIQGLLKSVGLRSEALATPQEFLRSKRAEGSRLPGPGCETSWSHWA